jgi:aryl-alcohol dehydrogenase-like predicted oxidoreductase
VLRIVRERGLGYTPFSPLAGGVLASRYQRGAEAPPDSRMSIIPSFLADLDDATWEGLDGLASPSFGTE